MPLDDEPEKFNVCLVLENGFTRVKKWMQKMRNKIKLKTEPFSDPTANYEVKLASLNRIK